MKWRTFLASIGLSWAAVGCQPNATLAQSPYAQINAPVVDPSLSRSQKPEGEASKPATPAIQQVSAPSKPTTTGPATPENVKSLLDIPLARTDNGKPGVVEAKIRAVVNGQPIFEDEIRDFIFPTLIRIARDSSLSESERNKLRARVYNEALQELINRELLLWDAGEKFKKQPKTIEKLKESASREFDRSLRERRRAAGIQTDEEFKRELVREGLSLEAMRRQYERNFLAKSYLSFMIGDHLDSAIGHQEILDYYEKHPEEFQGEDRVEWQDLFLLYEKYGSQQAARTAATQIRERLRAGEDFEKFVEYDDGESKLNHGLGSGHRPGEIRPVEAEAALFHLKDGEVGDLIEIATGIHLIRLIHREHAGLRPFDEKVQNAIRDKLRNELGNREMQRALQDLKRRSQIEVSHID